MTQGAMINANSIIRDLAGVRLNNLLQRFCGRDVKIILELSEGLWDVPFEAVEFERILFGMIAQVRDSLAEGGTIVLRTENVAGVVSVSVRH